MSLRLSAVLGVALAFAATAPAHASTLTVTGTGDSNGSCMAGACTTLRVAVDEANALMGPDTISLPAGAYTLTGGPIELTSEVTITGASARTTTISTGGARGFSIRGGETVTLQHVSVAGNGAGDDDGGLIANDGTLTLDHVRLSFGHAATGGAVSNAGTLTIRSSLLDQNVATVGGGAIASTGPAVTISDTAPIVTPVPLPAPTPAPTTTPASQTAPTVLIARVSGSVRLRPPGGAFAPLTSPQAVAYGASVDAIRGTAKVSPNAKQSVTAKGAVFTVTQSKGVTLLKTTSCAGSFTVDTRTGGFTTRTGKMTITSRKSAKWKVSNHCRKLTVLRGTVIG